jgi:lipoprotein-anchoring transpeptidase ErfK/SrfK
MRVFSLIALLVLSAGFCWWYQSVPRPIPGVIDLNTGVKWHDSLYKHLPANLDTTIIVRDANNTPLKFRQYIKDVFNHEGYIFQDRGVWRLQRMTEGARDTLKRGEHIVSRINRWGAFRPDTIKSWQVKLDAIAHTLAQADRILVLKSKRQLILQRKGLNTLTFNIDLGWGPTGRKEFDGDGKTPEGVYHVDCKYARGDVYYKSFLVSYPNEDEKNYALQKGRKPGMSILIHGTKPDKINAKDWTAGCIAMQNKDMDALFEHVAEGTVIEIRK